MMETPDGVLLYVPLIKELGMRWNDIKKTPRYELEGLLAAYHEYEAFHSMDGYDESDISDMSKNKPKVRKQWMDYLEKRRKYNEMMGHKEPSQGFASLLK